MLVHAGAVAAMGSGEPAMVYWLWSDPRTLESGKAATHNAEFNNHAQE